MKNSNNTVKEKKTTSRGYKVEKFTDKRNSNFFASYGSQKISK